MIERKRFIIKTKSIPILFWIIIVYLFSGSPYTTINTEISMSVVALAVVVFPYILFVKKRQTNGLLLLIVLVAIMILFPMIWHSEFQSRAYWRVLAIAVLASYLVKKYELNNIIRVFLKVMVIVSVVSLIGYILLNCTSLLNNLPTVKNVNGVEYGIGILFNYIKVYPERNCGIFWEPGIFASYLTLAIVFESITKPKSISWFRILLFVVTIITTTSSAGYALLILTIGVVMLRDSRLSGYKKIFAMCIIIVIGVIVLNLDSIILNTTLSNNEYLIKLTSTRLSESSRVTAIFHNLSIFRKNPLFGAGINSVLSQMSSWADISTTTYMLSIFGIMGLFYTIFIVWGIFSQKHINDFVKLLMFFILVSIVNKEPHINILFTWIIILGMASNTNAVYADTLEHNVDENKNI